MLREAREGLYSYLSRLEWRIRKGKGLHPLLEAQALKAIRVLKNIVSPRNERIIGYSALRYLWRLARDPSKAGEVCGWGLSRSSSTY